MEQNTWFHRLGIFLTGGTSNIDPAASLGGAASTIEYQELGAQINNPIPGLQLLRAFSENGEGQGLITVNGDGDLEYTPPGDVAGEAVEIAVNETKILLGGEDLVKAVMVKRVTRTLGFLGQMTLDLVRRANGVLAMGNLSSAERTAGKTTYRCIILKNQGTLDSLSQLSLWVPDNGPQATYSLGVEDVDSDGAVQTIADEETAPSGVVFQEVMGVLNALDIGEILPGESVGLWIKKEFPASGVVSAKETVDLEIFVGEEGSDDSSTESSKAGGFSRSLLEFYRVADSTLDRYELYVGEDQAPDFLASDQPVATSATLPFTHTLTPPASGTTRFHCCVRKRNQYDLLSFNQGCTIFEIDSDGAEELGPLTAPVRAKALSAPNSTVLAAASYLGVDRYPPDRWQVWAKEGSDPVPGVDSPVLDQAFSELQFQSLLGSLGAFTPGSTVHVLIGVTRDEDGEVATAAVVQHVVPLADALSADDSAVFGGGAGQGA